jgi:hypothetical protein
MLDERNDRCGLTIDGMSCAGNGGQAGMHSVRQKPAGRSAPMWRACLRLSRPRKTRLEKRT